MHFPPVTEFGFGSVISFWIHTGKAVKTCCYESSVQEEDLLITHLLEKFNLCVAAWHEFIHPAMKVHETMMIFWLAFHFFATVLSVGGGHVASRDSDESVVWRTLLANDNSGVSGLVQAVPSEVLGGDLMVIHTCCYIGYRMKPTMLLQVHTIPQIFGTSMATIKEKNMVATKIYLN